MSGARGQMQRAVRAAVSAAYDQRMSSLSAYGLVGSDSEVGFDLALALRVVFDCNAECPEDLSAFEELCSMTYGKVIETIHEMVGTYVPPGTLIVAVNPVIVGHLWMLEDAATQCQLAHSSPNANTRSQF